MMSDEKVCIKGIPYPIEIIENDTFLTDYNHLVSAAFKTSHQIWLKTSALISLYHI